MTRKRKGFFSELTESSARMSTLDGLSGSEELGHCQKVPWNMANPPITHMCRVATCVLSRSDIVVGDVKCGCVIIQHVVFS